MKAEAQQKKAVQRSKNECEWDLDVTMQVASAPNLDVTQEGYNALTPNKTGDWRKHPVAQLRV